MTAHFLRRNFQTKSLHSVPSLDKSNLVQHRFDLVCKKKSRLLLYFKPPLTHISRTFSRRCPYPTVSNHRVTSSDIPVYQMTSAAVYVRQRQQQTSQSEPAAIAASSHQSRSYIARRETPQSSPEPPPATYHTPNPRYPVSSKYHYLHHSAEPGLNFVVEQQRHPHMKNNK